MPLDHWGLNETNFPVWGFFQRGKDGVTHNTYL